MKTILNILKKAGGWRPNLYVRIENPPYLPLVIEAGDESGPLGLRALSVCHYGEQNGDLMRDPEMCFELSKPPLSGLGLSVYYFRNDCMGIEQYSRYREGDNYIVIPNLYEEHSKFAQVWDKNLRAQGFLEAFTDKSIRG
jgi:hypothetical protein